MVLAILSLLVAGTVPLVAPMVARAKAGEAPTMLEAIAHAELRHYRDTGSYIECAPAGEVPRASPAPFPEAACWQRLGIVPSGAVRYRYGVALVGDSFVASAAGDLDGDGTPSAYSMDGRTLSLTATDPLE